LTTYRGDVFIIPCRVDLSLIAARNPEADRECIVGGEMWSLVPPAEQSYTAIVVQLIEETVEE
jgi:hypothetical protein